MIISNKIILFKTYINFANKLDSNFFWNFFKEAFLRSTSSQANLTNLSQDNFSKTRVRKSRSVCIRRSIPCVLSVCSWDGNLFTLSHNTMACMRRAGTRERDAFASAPRLSNLVIIIVIIILVTSSSPPSLFPAGKRTRSHNNRDVRMRGCQKTCQTVQVIACGCRQKAGKACKGCQKTELPFCTPIFGYSRDSLLDLFLARFEVCRFFFSKYFGNQQNSREDRKRKRERKR